MPRILFVSADSSFTQDSKLKISDELRRIRQAIGEYTNFSIHEISEARTTDLTHALLNYRPDILHFAGHGTGGANASLILASVQGGGANVTPEDLRQILECTPNPPSVVVLNACYSNAFENAIKERVDVVIGTTTQQSDDTARLFAESFYRHLGNSLSIKCAFQLTKLELKTNGYQWRNLSIKHRGKVDPNEIVLYARPELLAMFQNATPSKKGSYRVDLYLRGVDQNVAAVTFQRVDTGWGCKATWWETTRAESTDTKYPFKSWMDTNCDSTMRVVAWSRNPDFGFGIESTVVAALKRHYGERPDPKIDSAIKTLERT